MQGDELDIKTHNKIGRKGERRWLLWLPDESLAGFDSVGTLIERGEEDALHLRYLTSLRDPWYAVEKVDPPQLLFGPMTQGAFRIVLNTARAIPSNSLYGIYLPDLDAPRISELASWLNSKDGQFMIRSEARHYSRLMKLDPRKLLNVRVPANLLS